MINTFYLFTKIISIVFNLINLKSKKRQFAYYNNKKKDLTYSNQFKKVIIHSKIEKKH